jgi:hypothetical protein
MKVTWQAVKSYWYEARLGLIYVSFILSFITAATVTYTDIPFVRMLFPSLTVYLIVGVLVGGFIVAPIIGHTHWVRQNPTDVLKGNEPLLKAIRAIVREETEDARKRK